MVCDCSCVYIQGVPGERGFNGVPGLPGQAGDSGPPGEPGPRGAAGSRVRGFCGTCMANVDCVCTHTSSITHSKLIQSKVTGFSYLSSMSTACVVPRDNSVHHTYVNHGGRDRV